MNKNKTSKVQKEPTSRTKWLILIGIIILVGLMIVVAIFHVISSTFAPKECSTVDCFVAAANDCTETIFDRQEDIGTVEYYIPSQSAQQLQLDPNGCTFSKEIVKVADNESSLVTNLLERRKLSCAYERGQFNERWVTSLIYDIENCDGDLKERIGQLLLFVEIPKQDSKTCQKIGAPVCGNDGKTYANKCMAGNVSINYEGPCKECSNSATGLC